MTQVADTSEEATSKYELFYTISKGTILRPGGHHSLETLYFCHKMASAEGDLRIPTVQHKMLSNGAVA